MTKYYRIKQFSQMTSVTVRTLQYYDDIDLLKPSVRSEAGYRLYTQADLLRLQQIITLKYLGLPLSTIQTILAGKHFNMLDSLRTQAKIFASEAERIKHVSALLEYMASQLEDAEEINWNSMANIINVLELNNMSDSVLKQYQVSDSELGKKTTYDTLYNPDKLFAIPRAGKRKEIGISPEALPFYGFDCWNHYEVSWLNAKGKPVVAIAQIIYDCATTNIIESKSLKLYFNSFNNTQFKDSDEVKNTVKRDLENRIGGSVDINICSVNDPRFSTIKPSFAGICLDDLDIECNEYLVNPLFLTTSEKNVEEILYSDLLKSNCLVTNQPDWGSVQIAYQGAQIDHANLLKYIVSFRNHNEFHEQCIERIFADIMKYCKPKKLTVYGRYTRRGGLDINPYRSTEKVDFNGKNLRLVRQ